MQKCVYAGHNNCTECKFVYYRQCPLFVKTRNNYIIRNLVPFKKVGDFKCTDFKVYYSQRVNDKLKTALARYAIERNKEVRVMTLNQAIDYTINQRQDLNDFIFLVEVRERLEGETDKRLTTLVSFLERQSEFNAVFLCSSFGLPLRETNLIKEIK